MDESGNPHHLSLSLLFLVQLPPPIHGVTVMSERVLREAASMSGINVRHLWTGGARELTDIGRKRFRKFTDFALFLLKLCAMQFSSKRYDIAYCALAPHGEALLRDALLIGAAKRTAGRVLVHLHTQGLHEVLDGCTFLQRVSRYLISGTELISLSEGTRVAAEASGRFKRVHMLGNSVPDPGEQVTQPSGRLRCGFLGNLDSRKGVLRFVDAIAALKQAGVPAQGTIVGTTSKYLRVEDVRAHAREKGISDLIETSGFVDEETKSKILGSLDLFIYLSDHDLAPLVLLESLAHSTVPIVFDTGAMREIVGPEFQENVISEKHDCDSYLAAIVSVARKYYEAPELLEAKKRAARRRYLELFSEEAFRSNLSRIIRPDLRLPSKSSPSM